MKLLCSEDITDSWTIWKGWFHAGLFLNSEDKMLFYWYHLNSVAVSFKRRNWPGPTSHAYFICSPHICVFCSASSTYGTTLYGKEEWCHLPSNSRIWTHTPTVWLEIRSYQRTLRKGCFLDVSGVESFDFLLSPWEGGIWFPQKEMGLWGQK